MRRPTPIMCLALALCPSAMAAVLQVPGHSATIQGAIDMASNGDEIVVAPGTYHEQLNLRGKAVVVRSSGGAAVTVIDGDGVRRGIQAHLGEGPATVVDGFTITDCFSSTNGAGVLIRAGSSPTLRRCVITGNEALNAGGGIMVRDAGSSPVLEECTIQDNVAGRLGGGVYVTDSSLVLIDCDIVSNDALRPAGAAVVADSYMGGGIAVVNGDVDLNFCTLRGNRAGVMGGGLLARGSSCELTDCVLEQNRALGDAGVATPARGGAVCGDLDSTVTLTACLVSANRAVHEGGGVACIAGSDLTLSDTRVLDNLATDGASSGGGVFSRDGDLTLDECPIEGNSAGSGGGVACVGAGAVVIEDCDLLDNLAAAVSGRGGALYVERGMSASNVLFEGNEAARGGGMAALGGAAMTLDTCTFRGNTASQGGGGLYNHDTSPDLTSCLFEANNVMADAIPVPGLGGGMWNAAESSPTLHHCSFTENNSARDGGGMANTDDSAPTLDNCAFVDNSAVAAGGGMYNMNASPALGMCRFDDNNARNGGGMANAEDASPLLTSCSFEGNEATERGGALHNATRSNPELLACELTLSTAGLEGGGISSDVASMPRITQTRVCDNLPENVAGPVAETAIGGNEICVPPPPPPAVPGDVNGDGVVNVDDLVAIISAWGSDDEEADLNGDGMVDVDDLTIAILNWSA